MWKFLFEYWVALTALGGVLVVGAFMTGHRWIASIVLVPAGVLTSFFGLLLLVAMGAAPMKSSDQADASGVIVMVFLGGVGMVGLGIWCLVSGGRENRNGSSPVDPIRQDAPTIEAVDVDLQRRNDRIRRVGRN